MPTFIILTFRSKVTTGLDEFCPELDGSIMEPIPVTPTPVMVGRMLSFLGKMCISASFGLGYLIMAEVFPTEVASTCLGFIILFSRVGPVITPFLVQVRSSNVQFLLIILNK